MTLLDILEEHLEEADFLWQQRENALADRVYTLNDLAELKERLLAHLNGLVLAEKHGWDLLQPKLAGGKVGEILGKPAGTQRGQPWIYDRDAFWSSKSFLLNPVRSGIAPRPEAYPFSSDRAFVEEPKQF